MIRRPIQQYPYGGFLQWSRNLSFMAISKNRLLL